jgi:hypothetical protein
MVLMNIPTSGQVCRAFLRILAAVGGENALSSSAMENQAVGLLPDLS